MARIDVVIPCYNYGRYLEECVRSVLDQSLADVRVLIIDDASSDDSAAVAGRLAASDPRVEVISHPVNRGHIATYNEGLIDWARADYSLLLSADDVLTPGALQRAIDILDSHPNVGLLYGHAAYWHEGQARPALRTRQSGVTIWSGLDWLRIICKRGHCVTSTPTAIVRTSVQQAIGGYRADLPHTGDFEMWMRFAVHADVAYIKGVDQALYRIHGRSMTVDRIPIIDLKQRKAAYDALFSSFGSLVPDAERLQQQANRKMAKEALWRVCSAYHRGRLASAPVDELLAFARETYPAVTTLPEYWGMRWRQLVGPRLCPYLQPLMLPAVARRINSWLWWKTWRFRGI